MRIYIKILLALAAMFVKILFAQTTSTITYDAGTSIDIQTGADVCATNIIINGTFSGGGTICNGALPVTLSSFNSLVSKNNVTLSWATETEVNNSGFDVERHTLSGAEGWDKIGFIHGSGNSSTSKSYIFEDKKLKTGKYQYRLKQIDYNGNYEYYDLENDVAISPPNKFSMSQNYPNPSNPKSRIDYSIPVSGLVSIKLYNLLGQEVLTIVNEMKEAGYYTAEIDGSSLSSGIYIYKIVSGLSKSVRKLVLLK